MVHIRNGVLFRCKEKWNTVICRKIDGTWDHYINQKKSITEGQVLELFFSFVEGRVEKKMKSVGGGHMKIKGT